MSKIFKYIIDPINPAIEMPKGAEIIKASTQGTDFCIWAIVDDSVSTEIRNIHAFPTGEELPYQMGAEYKYIDTGFFDNGLVFHAFERLGL